jgi:hypothetical protein
LPSSSLFRGAAAPPIRSPGQFHQSSADPLSDLWHDCISEASQSVHPIGTPISHSIHGGFCTVASGKQRKQPLAVCITQPQS